MIIYGVFWDGTWGEELQNLYRTPERAQAYIDSRKSPSEYFMTEMTVY
jgi:hypothetical protein